MAHPCEQIGAIAALEANNANIMREISEIKSDVKEIKTGMSDLSKAVLSFQETADYKYVTRKEFEESGRIAWLIKIVFGSSVGLGALASFLHYVLKTF